MAFKLDYEEINNKPRSSFVLDYEEIPSAPSFKLDYEEIQQRTPFKLDYEELPPQSTQGLAGQPPPPSLQWTPPGQGQPNIPQLRPQTPAEEKYADRPSSYQEPVTGQDILEAVPILGEYAQIVREVRQGDRLPEDLAERAAEDIVFAALFSAGTGALTRPATAVIVKALPKSLRRFVLNPSKATIKAIKTEAVENPTLRSMVGKVERFFNVTKAKLTNINKMSDTELQTYLNEIPKGARRELAIKYPRVNKMLRKGRTEIAPTSPEQAELLAIARGKKPTVASVETPTKPTIRPIEPFPEKPPPAIKEGAGKISIPEKAETFIKAGEQLARDFTGLEGKAPSVSKLLGNISVKKIMIDPKIAHKEILKATEKASKLGFKEGLKIGKENLSVFKDETIRNKAIEKIKIDVNRKIKKIKSLDTSNLPLHYKERINELKNNFDFTKPSGKTMMSRERMMKWVDQQKEAGEPIAIPEAKLALLYKKPTNEMTIGEVDELYDLVTSLYKQGRLMNRLITDQAQREVNTIVNQAISVINKRAKPESLEIGIEKTSIENERNLLTKVLESSKDRINKYDLVHQMPEMILKDLDGGKDGALSKAITDKLYDARTKELTMQDSDRAYFESNISQTQLRKTLLDRIKINNKTLKVDNIMDIYGKSLNKHDTDVLRNSGLTDSDLTAIKAWMEKPENTEYKKIIDTVMKDYFPAKHQQASAVYERLTQDRLPIQENYYPSYFTERLGSFEAIEMDMQQKSLMSYPKVDATSIHKRIKHGLSYSRFSFADTLYKYSTDMNRWISYAETIRDSSKILRHPSMRNSIAKVRGKYANNVLDKWLKDISTGMDLRDKNAIERIVGGLRTAAYTTMLGFNIMPGFRTTGSLYPAIPIVGEVNITKALSRVLANPIGSFNYVAGKSKMMKHRGFSWNIDLQRLTAQRNKMQYIFGRRNIKQIAAETALIPIWLGDKITTTTDWIAAEYKGISMGLKGNDLVRYADKVIGRTQPTGDLIQQAEVYRSGELVKTMMLFTNYFNKVYNLEREAIAPLLQKIEGTAFERLGTRFKQGAHAAHVSLWTLLVPAYMSASLYAKRPLGTKEGDIKKIAKSAIDQSTAGLFLIRQIFSPIRRDILDFYVDEFRKVGKAKGFVPKTVQVTKALAFTQGFPRKLVYNKYIRDFFKMGDIARLNIQSKGGLGTIEGKGLGGMKGGL